MGFLPVKEGFVSIDGELLTVRSAHAFRSLMVYLPQEMQRLTHHYRAPQPRSMAYGTLSYPRQRQCLSQSR